MESHRRVTPWSIPEGIRTPAYVVDLERLRMNLSALSSLRERSGANILLALKGFAMFATFPLVRQYLDGVCASGLNEARLGRETFDKQVHTYSPAFKADEFGAIVSLSNHISFNSMRQWRTFGKQALTAGISCGLRVNPECSVADVELYDPCAPGSRLGIRRDQIDDDSLNGITGLHLHALCEQDTHALARVIEALELKFGELLHGMQWLNLGGGHHITRPDYNIDHLCELLARLKKTYDVELFLEPGEAVVLDAGFLVTEVLDVVKTARGKVAILDISVTCHMPDVLEMPYRPVVTGAGDPGTKVHTYMLAGNSCLAGDQVGEYAFDGPLAVGDRVVFEDMAHYTMVKTTHFNGVHHPSLTTWDPALQQLNVIREFGYADYRDQLS